MTETMQDSGVEWIGAIPKDWRLDRLKDIIPSILSGGTPSSTNSDYWDGDIIWITPTDFQKYKNTDVIDDSNRKITFTGLQSCSSQLLPVGTVIMASRATIGISKIAGVELCTNQGFISFVCNGQITNKFFFYGVESYLGRLFEGIAVGTTFKEISRNTVKQQYLVFPPIPEQQAIAQYLDERCGKLDSIIAIKKQQIQTLDALRQSIIYQAVTKGLDDSVELVDSGVEWLGEIPKGWKVSKARYVSKIFIPQRNKPEINDESGCYWVTMENMNDETISKTDKLISDEAQKNAGSKTLPALSVIASCVGTFGIASVNKVEIIINQQLQAYIPERINAYYLRYLITVSEKYFELVCTRTTIDYVNGDKFGNLPVIVPPISEQQKIVDYLKDEMQRLAQLKANLTQQIGVLLDYKKSLIYECVTGKKRVFNRV
jgi:type I restriction enzyme S subunit